MKPETLRRLIDRIEKSPKPVEVYTDGKGIWCGTYPETREFDVELIGTYYALCPSYDPEQIEAWLLEDFEEAR